MSICLVRQLFVLLHLKRLGPVHKYLIIGTDGNSVIDDGRDGRVFEDNRCPQFLHFKDYCCRLLIFYHSIDSRRSGCVIPNYTTVQNPPPLYNSRFYNTKHGIFEIFKYTSVQLVAPYYSLLK